MDGDLLPWSVWVGLGDSDDWFTIWARTEEQAWARARLRCMNELGVTPRIMRVSVCYDWVPVPF